jgi:hypothetical protein
VVGSSDWAVHPLISVTCRLHCLIFMPSATQMSFPVHTTFILKTWWMLLWHCVVRMYVSAQSQPAALPNSWVRIHKAFSFYVYELTESAISLFYSRVGERCSDNVQYGFV